MLIGKHISKTYQGDPILKKIDFRIGNNKKIGIVGRNGCGKTTLFKIIAGIEGFSEGNLENQGEIIGYLPQEFKFPNELVGEYLEKFLENPWDFYMVDTIVDLIQFNNFDQYQSLHTLSEGQKMKVKLIEILLKEPTLILIDEPTNHLDIEGIMWFEKYIKKLDKTVVMISHDRSFLNATVDEIWEIENGEIIQIVGNYDTYKEEKIRLIDKMDQEYKLFMQRKEKLEKLLESARKIKGGKKRGRAVSSAKKRIEREVEENKKEKYSVKKMGQVEFDTDIREGKLMVKFDDVIKSYGEKKVFEDLDFEIRGKDKIWLFGPNGAGKTTLVKLIMGDESPTNGEVIIGESTSVGYFAQKQTHLDYEENLLDHFMKSSECPYDKAFGILKKFLFEKEALQKKVKNLSPGERARFAFAIFAYKDYDLLILDEPTNHLDIETKEAIEMSLNEYEGTLLLVSHDRYFVESVGIEKMLNLREGRIEWL